MVAAAWGGAQDADLTLLLVDARSGATAEVREIAARLGTTKRRSWLALNKTDLVSPAQLLPLIATLSEAAPFEQTYMVSAVTGDGVDALADALAATMPEGPHLYPDDEITDLPDRLLAAELVREQIFMQTRMRRCRMATTAETETLQERPDGSVRWRTIYVARPGYKAILLAAGGSKIADRAAPARQQLGVLLERKVHLFLNARRTRRWDEESARPRATRPG